MKRNGYFYPWHTATEPPWSHSGRADAGLRADACISADQFVYIVYTSVCTQARHLKHPGHPVVDKNFQKNPFAWDFCAYVNNISRRGTRTFYLECPERPRMRLCVVFVSIKGIIRNYFYPWYRHRPHTGKQTLVKNLTNHGLTLMARPVIWSLVITFRSTFISIRTNWAIDAFIQFPFLLSVVNAFLCKSIINSSSCWGSC